MSDRSHIDEILKEWPYEPGAISARLVQVDEDRDVLQMRIELGLLQMEATNRPDGERPQGCETYLDYLLQQGFGSGEETRLSEEQCLEVDREFLQYYHRRICWLALREFDRAAADADHTLMMMDLAVEHSPDEHWAISHEQYRPFVLFHRTQAAALSALETDGAEAAISEINQGLERIRRVFEQVDGQEQFADDTMVEQLLELQTWVREHYEIGRTLSEQLADAVAAEQYEVAARLRDELESRRRSGH